MQDSNTGPNLSPRQLKAITCLLAGPTIAQAAKDAGVSRSTLYKWMDTPEFRLALLQAETEALDGLARKLAAHQEKALDGLAALLESKDDWVKLRAATVIGEQFQRMQEVRIIGGRLEALEALAQELEK